MTALIIVAILAALIIQSGSYMIERAQRTSCTNNLKSLFAATSSYMMDYQMWPQVSTADITGTSYAQGWIDALTPYQIGKVNWICPSVQRLLNNPDYIQPQDVRVDYFATPFDTNAASPGRYGTQPWFAERANVHGDGNLMIFASGTVKSLNQAVADSISQPPPAAQ